MYSIKLKRIYTRLEVTDGLRILVDRLWPRGVRHSTSNVDVWIKDIGPSDKLRKYFSHDPKKWVIFKRRYRAELLRNPLLEKLIQIAATESMITLVYASYDDKHNSAVVLREILERRLKKLERAMPPVA
jgi:uncharacterized protein YeaO (DUF488 family)